MPAEQCEVAEHGREGHKKTPESCKTRLLGDTSFMQLQRDRGKQKEGRRAGPTGVRRQRRKATIFLEWANDEVELKRSNQESFDES